MLIEALGLFYKGGRRGREGLHCLLPGLYYYCGVSSMGYWYHWYWCQYCLYLVLIRYLGLVSYISMGQSRVGGYWYYICSVAIQVLVLGIILCRLGIVLVFWHWYQALSCVPVDCVLCCYLGIAILVLGNTVGNILCSSRLGIVLLFRYWYWVIQWALSCVPAGWVLWPGSESSCPPIVPTAPSICLCPTARPILHKTDSCQMLCAVLHLCFVRDSSCK